MGGEARGELKIFSIFMLREDVRKVRRKRLIEIPKRAIWIGSP